VEAGFFVLIVLMPISTGCFSASLPPLGREPLMLQLLR
jgi:hypothetical protein